MKQYNKLKLVNNILVTVTGTYNQIFVPSGMHKFVYTKLHTKIGHLDTKKLVDLARQHVYWSKMHRDIEVCIRKKF